MNEKSLLDENQEDFFSPIKAKKLNSIKMYDKIILQLVKIVNKNNEVSVDVSKVS